MRTICPHCKVLIPYSSRLAGRPATCPACHRTFDMPSPDEQAKLIEQVGALKRDQRARFERARQRRLAAPPGSEYPALRLIAGLLQFLAVVVLALCLVNAAITVAGDAPWPAKAWLLAVSIALVVLAPVLLWGLGELILLLIDMANEVRATRLAIARLRRKKGP